MKAWKNCSWIIEVLCNDNCCPLIGIHLWQSTDSISISASPRCEAEQTVSVWDRSLFGELSVSPSSPLYVSLPVFMSFRVFFFLCLSQSLSVTHRHTHTQKWQFQSSALWKSRYWTGASVRLVALIAVRGRMGVAVSWNSWKVSSKTLYSCFIKKSLLTWNSPATVKSTGWAAANFKGLIHPV